VGVCDQTHFRAYGRGWPKNLDCGGIIRVYAWLWRIGENAVSGRRNKSFPAEFQPQNLKRFLKRLITLVDFFGASRMDRKRLENGPIFQIMPVARAIVNARTAKLVSLSRSELANTPRGSILQNAGIEVLQSETQAFICQFGAQVRNPCARIYVGVVSICDCSSD
jgi:hypothetical protein